MNSSSYTEEKVKFLLVYKLEILSSSALGIYTKSVCIMFSSLHADRNFIKIN
jgi:hypothetical protein